MVNLVTGLALAGPPEVTPAEPPPTEAAETRALRDELRALREELELAREERRRLREDLAPTPPARPPAPTRHHVVSYADGQSYVGPGETVDEVVAFGTDVRVDGLVLGSATALGGDVYIGPQGEVREDAVSVGGRIHLADGAKLGGDRVALDTSPVVVHGDPDHPGSWLQSVFRRLMAVLSLGGAGALIGGLFPARVSLVAEQVSRHPLASAALGLAFSGLIVAFGGMFAIVTLGLGAPLTAVAFAVLTAGWLLGFTALGQAIGDHLGMDPPRSRWVGLLLVSVLFAASDLFGLAGDALMWGLGLAGTGAALHTRFGHTLP